MAALNFPANPANQNPANTFSPSSSPDATTNGATYIWNGTAWTGYVEGAAQYWARAGSVLTPLNTGDTVTVGGSNNISLFPTGNANFDGNVGIGTSSPSSLLHLASNSPYITFEDVDNNQDWQLQATAWFALRNQTTASELLRIDSFGRVGIGTSNPGELLEVSGDNNPEIKINATNTGTNSPGLFFNNQGQRNWQIWSDRASDQFRIGNNNRAITNLAITSTGNVGIGTDDPQAKLHVKSDSIGIPAKGVAGSMQVGEGDNFGVMLGCNSSGVGYIQPQRNDGADTTYNLTLNPNGGNVGIGTDTPDALLTIKRGTIKVTDENNITTGDLGSYGCIWSNNAALANAGYQYEVYTGENDDRTLSMVVNPDGNVGIGTDTPQEKLSVTGNISISGSLIADGTDTLDFESKSANSDYYFFKSDESANGSLRFKDITSNRIYNFPDANGTIALAENIPASLTFKGTVPNVTGTAPSAVAGDFYLVLASSTAGSSWTGIDGSVIATNQFVLYTAGNEWKAGATLDGSAFVTLATNQTIQGEKTFQNTLSTSNINAAGTIKSTSGGFTFPDNTTQTTAAIGANNGQINVETGDGLTATGTNATANQSANTTRTLSLDTSYTDGLYLAKNISSLPTLS